MDGEIKETAFVYKKTGTTDTDELLTNYGVTDAIGPMPLNSIINNMQVSINN